MSPKILAISISKIKHIKKSNVGCAYLKENYGIIGDAHSSSDTRRQISLLAMESINKMRDLGLNVHPGDFAENLTTKGINLIVLSKGTKLNIGKEVTLEITQIGKKCHNHCAIYQQAGDCVMPKEGIFAIVIKSGDVKTGDKIEII